MDAKAYLAGLPTWDGASRLEGLDKDLLLAAEVALPVPPGFQGPLQVISLRRPFSDRTEQVVVALSRLPVP